LGLANPESRHGGLYLNHAQAATDAAERLLSFLAVHNVLLCVPLLSKAENGDEAGHVD
jgi:hypothetical protein